jgi:hypothetical protein
MLLAQIMWKNHMDAMITFEKDFKTQSFTISNWPELMGLLKKWVGYKETLENEDKNI